MMEMAQSLRHPCPCWGGGVRRYGREHVAEAATVCTHSLTYALTYVCTQDLCFLQMTRTLQEASAAQEWRGVHYLAQREQEWRGAHYDDNKHG